jgi:ligand-binding sensor domain-containing protein/GAF domain-containing protein/anti-sigma regulatory factor (Ser/Thr protein kinase)
VHSFIASAQDISFYHLNAAQGLSDNLVTSATRDKSGVLWVGTAEGLNTFDGYIVKKFYKEKYPSLGSNHIADLICDDNNRVWIRSNNGKITLVDENRNFISVPVLDSGRQVDVSFLCKTKSRGIIALFGKKIYSLKKKDHYFFEPVDWTNEHVFVRLNFQQAGENNDTLIFTGNNKLIIFDAGSLKILYSLTVPSVIGAAMLNNEEILATTEKNRELLRIRLRDGQVLKNYGLLNDQNEEPVKSYLRYIRKMKDGRYIITSGYGGVYVFDAQQEKIRGYQHDALDTRSVSANNTFYVYTESSGYVFVTTRSAGLNYFNCDFHVAGYKEAFMETTGNTIFHGFINYITQHPGGNLWLGTQSRLIEWNRQKNQVRFYEYGEKRNIPLNGTEEVRCISFDKNDNVWLGLNRFGIVVLDKNRKVKKYIEADSSKQTDFLPGNFVHNIVPAPDHKLWIGTSSGLCIINPDNFTFEKSGSHPLLKLLAKTSTYNIWFRTKDEVWVGTNKGAYRYNAVTGEIIHFTPENGLTNTNALCFTADQQEQIYIGTSNGLNLVKGNSIVQTYTRSNGLRSDRCFGLITDNNGQVWIGNDNAMLSYNPMNKSFTLYDDSYGLSPSGFRLLSYYQTSNGEQLWGSDLGLSYFFPENLQQIKYDLQANINSFSAGGRSFTFTPGKEVQVAYADNNLNFSFSAIDLYSNKNLTYEYKLEGADENWIRTGNPQQVTYSKLDPGHYTFLVRVSKEGNNWVNATNPVSIHIITPWWKSWWFKAICALAIVLAIAGLLRTRNKKIARQKEELETEQAINYFASSIYEQKTAEDILWDVTKNCISRLHFEDCVIYMKDETRNVLVQKAAWGPKTGEGASAEDEPAKILNPIDIPVGKGIVGTVALTGKAEIIPDTSLDSRYIVDDERRLSEIAVPIIYNKKVIGVIDSEHPKKNFFTSRHLSILTTIASLCANKIIRSQAEEARQKAQLELLEHQRKMAEVQLKSLRLQMSPHFLFNALNSIQQIILSGNDAAATKYLSRFSRLLRLVLQHSDREKIPLKEEVETLGLYLELESLRFEDSFQYAITVENNMDTDEIKIPTLLVQPFVENAIWHGLLHLPEGGIRRLSVRFSEDNNDNLICVVEDNGIGRHAAMKKSNRDAHTGKGLTVAEERVKTFNEQNTRKSFFKIDDLYDETGSPCGTSVTITLPLVK